MVEKHIEDSLAKIRVIFEKASSRIEALKDDEKIPATKLAEDLAKEYGMKGPILYPTLKFLFDGYPDVEISKGAHGGIRRKKKVVLTQTVVDKVQADVKAVLDQGDKDAQE